MSCRLPVGIGFSVLILALATACSSPRPRAVGYPYSEQKRFEAADHWKQLAADFADEIADARPHDQVPVALEFHGDTPFHTAFKRFLRMHLANRNVQVSQKADTPLVAHIRSQTIIHNTVENTDPYDFAITDDGLWWSEDARANTAAELIVSVSIQNIDDIEDNYSRIAYIDPKDVSHYQSGSPDGIRTFQVTGENDGAPR